MKLYLAQKYKTRDGAMKRCGFENSLAKFEFEAGRKAHHYHYSITQDGAGMWRVARCRLDQVAYSLATLARLHRA